MVKKEDSAKPMHEHKSAPHPLEEKLLENLVELQKVHTNLLQKFDSLSTQISSLLALFESAARSFADHPANQVAEKDKEFLEKVDRLLEQNKVIAKGLTVVEERMRERVYGAPTPRPNFGSEQSAEESIIPQPSTRPLPRF